MNDRSITSPENREHLVKGEKEIRTKGLGFIRCDKRDLIKIKTDFSELKNWAVLGEKKTGKCLDASIAESNR